MAGGITLVDAGPPPERPHHAMPHLRSTGSQAWPSVWGYGLVEWGTHLWDEVFVQYGAKKATLGSVTCNVTGRTICRRLGGLGPHMTTIEVDRNALYVLPDVRAHLCRDGDPAVTRAMAQDRRHLRGHQRCTLGHHVAGRRLAPRRGNGVDHPPGTWLPPMVVAVRTSVKHDGTCIEVNCGGRIRTPPVKQRCAMSLSTVVVLHPLQPRSSRCPPRRCLRTGAARRPADLAHWGPTPMWRLWWCCQARRTGYTTSRVGREVAVPACSGRQWFRMLDQRRADEDAWRHIRHPFTRRLPHHRGVLVGPLQPVAAAPAVNARRR